MIIVSRTHPARHGEGTVRSIYELFADTKTEVPQTGAATKLLITGLTEDLPPTTILYTKKAEFAILGTDDNWSWIGEEGS